MVVLACLVLSSLTISTVSIHILHELYSDKNEQMDEIKK